jgi:LPXTG-site transpeptidase (sortase) family protein
VLGLVGLGALWLLPPTESPVPALAALGKAVFAPGSAHRMDGTSPGQDGLKLGASASTSHELSAQSAAQRTEPVRPITHVAIPAIGLDADVVDAALVDVDGGYTWQVPAFKVGHAESTAGAGQAGNAVLLGHVTSVHSGNVFADLDQAHVGDTVRVFSDNARFDYTVVSTQAVPRSDSLVIDPTAAPSVSLITCTGVWLPTIWDYTERLVVHAELSQ